jgi:hypothetical protein
MVNHCKDCRKEISKKAERCRSCSVKFRLKPLQKSIPQGWQTWIQLATLVVLAGTLIPIAVQACATANQTRILQADFETRTRPYLAIGNLTAMTQGNSSTLKISITNFGPLPAMSIAVNNMRLRPGTGYVGGVIVWIDANPATDIVIFPGGSLVKSIDMTKSEYENIVKLGGMMIELGYASGKQDYWYEAEIDLATDGSWSISSQRSN